MLTAPPWPLPLPAVEIAPRVALPLLALFVTLMLPAAPPAPVPVALPVRDVSAPVVMSPDVLFVRLIAPAAPPVLLPVAPAVPEAVMAAVVMPVWAVMLTSPALRPALVVVPPLAVTSAASATLPVSAVMLILPAWPLSAPVELMVLAALPVTLAPRRVMPPACADRAALVSVKPPAPLLSASARKSMLPVPVTVMPALTAISL